MELMLLPLVKDDPEIGAAKKMHDEPTVSKYISISDDYFDYVTTTENVTYFKIEVQNEFVGGLHTEVTGTVMYLSICIRPQYRRKGFAASALKKLIPQIPHAVKKMQVSIDETNVPSIRLFEGLGFSKIGQEEELTDYVLDLR